MKDLIAIGVLAIAATVVVTIFAHEHSKCRYCGSEGYGSGCLYSPTKYHEHRDSMERCEWCGSSSYGPGCLYSPTKIHEK